MSFPDTSFNEQFCHKVTIITDETKRLECSNLLSDYMDVVSEFYDKENKYWVIEGYCSDQPDIIALEAALLNYDIKSDAIQHVVLNNDWVNEYIKSQQPIQAGHFFIYPSHHKNSIPKNYISLQIDAEMAFGSGEHETTSTCLEALSDLYDNHHQTLKGDCLDMGCGSGILAMAMKKLWPDSMIIGADNDPESVRTSIKNSKLNNLSIDYVESDGFHHKSIKSFGPYSVIMANVLARPLIEMATDFSKYKKKNGYLIISGLLDTQEDLINLIYEKNNLKLLKKYKKNEWVTLTYQ